MNINRSSTEPSWSARTNLMQKLKCAVYHKNEPHWFLWKRKRAD